MQGVDAGRSRGKESPKDATLPDCLRDAGSFPRVGRGRGRRGGCKGRLGADILPPRVSTETRSTDTASERSSGKLGGNSARPGLLSGAGLGPPLLVTPRSALGPPELCTPRCPYVYRLAEETFTRFRATGSSASELRASQERRARTPPPRRL